jgi:hypothetical protein
MAQEQEKDDLGVFLAHGLPKQGERVWCVELAKYLNIAEKEVRKFARRRLVLHAVRNTPAGKRIYWVTPHVAAQIIIHVRVRQELGSKKTDWHKQAARVRTGRKPGFGSANYVDGKYVKKA